MCSRLLIFFLLAILPVLSVVTFAQEREYKFDCSKLPIVSLGCNSYNELVKATDKDLLNTMRQDMAVVCFRPDEDVFFTLSHENPGYGSFVKVQSSSAYEAPGYVFYTRYKNGVTDDFQFVFGRWMKLAKDGQKPYFVADPKAEAGASISDNEVVFSYSFQNLSKTKTSYSVAVRLSTLRFVEKYQWDNPPEPTNTKKGSKPERNAASLGQTETSGYCASFTPLTPQ